MQKEGMETSNSPAGDPTADGDKDVASVGAPPPTLGRRVARFSGLALAAATVLDLSSLAGLGLVRAFLSATLGLRVDHAELAAALVSAALAFSAGWAATALSKRVGFWELLAAAAIATGAGYGLLLLWPGPGAATFAIVPEGALSFAPAFAGLGMLLVSSIGATVGFMLGAGSSLDLSFGYEAFVAKSHLRLSRKLLAGLALLVLGIVPGVAAIAMLLRKQKRSPTLIMTVISIGGVAVGVMALTVVLSVMSGFEADLKTKILGTNAHAIVLKYGAFDEWKEAAQTVRGTPGVIGVSPFVLNEVMVTTETNLAGALIKGIDPKTVGEVTELPREIQEGQLEWLDTPERIPVLPSYDARGIGKGELDELQRSLEGLVKRPEDGLARRDDERPPEVNELPGLVLGRELARQLRVFVGDPVTVVSPIAGEIGPMGPQPKSMQFRVAAVFFSGMYEYDSKFVYISLDRAQSFFKMGKGVTGLELKVNDIDDARRISRSVLTRLEGYPFRVKDWGEMNRNLFSALKLEKIVMGVILTFIVLVACFNILSTLVMLVLEKGKEISILKSMGAKDASIMKIFVLEGLAIGLIGAVLGVALGFLLCVSISIFPIPLDPEVYYIPNLPVKIDGLQFVLVGVLSVVLAYLATIVPALYASRLGPVEGLRND